MTTIDWLLKSDAAIRWQVMRDLTSAPADAVAAERSCIATHGWGDALLRRQRADGKWGDDVAVPVWMSTLGAMVLLKDFGVDPADARVRGAVDGLEGGFTWGDEFGDLPFFEGEVEPCINGRVLALGAYFGHPSRKLLDRLLGEQLADGGWNCDAERGSVRSSFHSTICVLEGLLAWEQSQGPEANVTESRRRGEEYLLERKLFRRLSTGRPIEDRKARADWTQFAFPPTWHYDILRGLDYFRATGDKPDPRLAEAVQILTSRRNDDGRWPLTEHRPDVTQLKMEDGAGHPSRWNTLRAMRVLRWWNQ